MFEWVIAAGRFIQRVYYKAKEVAYDVLCFFGADVSPSHFTRQDKKNYDEWVSDYEKLIKLITRESKMPDYMRVKTHCIGVYETHGHYEAKIGKYLDRQSDKLLRQPLWNIIARINKYLSLEEQRKGFLARRISASQSKLDPLKMVLWFLHEHLKSQVIYYSDKQSELDRLNGLIKYISALAYKDSVKKHSRFHVLLLYINRNLKVARDTLEKRVKLTRFKTELHCAVNYAKSIIDDLKAFYFNLFNFGMLSGQSIERDTVKGLLLVEKTKVNKLLRAVNRFLTKDLDFDKLDCDEFLSRIEKMSEHDLRSTDKIDAVLSGMMTVFKSLFLEYKIKDENYEKLKSARKNREWRRLMTLQHRFVEFVVIFKIMQYCEQKIEKSYLDQNSLSVVQLKTVLFVLKEHANEVINAINNMIIWDEMIEEYRTAPDTDEIYSKRAGEVQKVRISARDSAKDMLAKVMECESIIAASGIIASNKDYTNKNLKEILLALQSKKTLKGKSSKFIDAKIKNFLNSLRDNNYFNPKIKMALIEFFVIKSEGCGAELAEGIINAVDLSQDPSFVYYTILLKCFINIIKISVDNDFTQQDKKQLIDKFKLFLVDNFLLHDEASIMHLLDVLVEEVSNGVKIDNQNKALRTLIEKHLEFFEKNIMDFIEQNSSIFENKEDPDNQDLLTRLERFVNKITAEIKKQSKLADKCRARLVQLSFGGKSQQLCKIEKLWQDAADHMISAQKTNQVLVKSLEFITNLTSSYMAFKDNYSLIIDETAHEDVDKIAQRLKELETIEKIREKLKQAGISSKGNLIELEDACNRLDNGVKKSRHRLYKKLRALIISYKENLENISEFKLRYQYLYGYIKGVDIIFEHSVANYLYNLVIDTKKYDRCVFVKIAAISKCFSGFDGSKSGELSEFISNLQRIIGDNIKCKRVPKVKFLATKSWDFSVIHGGLQDAVHQQEEKIAKKMDAAIQMHKEPKVLKMTVVA